MDKQKVILVHFSLHPGGIEVLLPDIIMSNTDYLFSPFVIRPPEKDKPDVYREIPVNVTFGSFNNIVALVKLFYYAFRNRGCIFHAFNTGPLFLLAIRLAGVKRLVYSIHGTQYWSGTVQKVFLRSLWRIAMSKRYVVTSNSLFSAEVFRRQVLDIGNIILLYNPISTSRFFPLPDRKYRGTPEVIIYCGRLDKGKNLDEWISIATRIKAQYTDTVFEIYGNGSEYERLGSLIKNAGADTYITLKGHTEYPEEAYRRADLMIFLSQYESFGNVVVESVMCGTPVIAGKIPSMAEIFRDYPEMLVEMNENTADEIMGKIKDYRILVETTKMAVTSFNERFNHHRHMALLGDIYKGLVC